MALQATTLHPSAFSVPKEGKPSTSIKEYSLFGVSLSDHAKSDFSSFALKCKVVDPHLHMSTTFNVVFLYIFMHCYNTGVSLNLTITQATPAGKKTLIKGCVIITGASSLRFSTRHGQGIG
ncbi:hypothetical protein Dimus_012635 [Dionaea muscipula]